MPSPDATPLLPWLPLLPELDRLRGLVENSDWHNDDPYEQSLRLARWVEELPAGVWGGRLDAPADPREDRHSLRALLAFVALIHDLGKAETYQRLADGTTRCPGHEAASARLAPAFCARFDFSQMETEWIVDLVSAHGEPYTLFKKAGGLPGPQQREAVRAFEREHAGILLPLLALAYGDVLTSHLGTRNPPKYGSVLNFYQPWLERVASGQDVNGA